MTGAAEHDRGVGLIGSEDVGSEDVSSEDGLPRREGARRPIHFAYLRNSGRRFSFSAFTPSRDSSVS